MSQIFYIDPDFEKGIHDKTLFKFERIYQGPGIKFLIVGFIVGVLILSFCWWRLDNFFLDELSFYEHWRETQVTLIACETISMAEAETPDYLHHLTYEFTVVESENQQRIQSSSPLFLNEDRCGEMLSAGSISIRYEPVQPYRSIVIDTDFSPSYSDETDNLALSDNWKFYLAIANLGLLGILGIVYPIKYLLDHRKWRKLIEEGEFLKGKIVEITRKIVKVKSEEFAYYQVLYAFTSSENIGLEGEFNLDVERVEVENPPQIGTQLLILYANEHCYSPV